MKLGLEVKPYFSSSLNLSSAKKKDLQMPERAPIYIKVFLNLPRGATNLRFWVQNSVKENPQSILLRFLRISGRFSLGFQYFFFIFKDFPKNPKMFLRLFKEDVNFLMEDSLAKGFSMFIHRSTAHKNLRNGEVISLILRSLNMFYLIY